ncbi:MAG: cation:proton antiporter [Candidatus Nanopelagicales bacterium]|nr:cation:proton antiporter [Candidatus Nanopelagicales bacterium]
MDIDLALLELGIILVLLGFAGGIARRVGIPAIPLYLLVGLVLGVGGFLPIDDAAEFIEVGSELGVILLLLGLGMEFSPDEFMSSLKRHRSSGIVDAVLSATPGAAAGFILGMGWQGALVLAGITWISSSGIIARMLTDLGRLGNRETPAILSVLVIEDIAMAVYLPVTAVLLVGGEWWLALIGAAVALLAVALALLASRTVGNRLTRILGRAGREQVVIRTVGVAVLVASLAELIHVSSAVGAFLVGLSLNGSTATKIAELIAPLRDLFAAMFFVGFTLAIDPATLWPILPAALILALFGIGSKYLVGRYAARVEGASRAGQTRAGTALIARGEFSIVIAGLAVVSMPELPISPLASAYVLLLAVIGPVLARYSGQNSRMSSLRSRLRRPGKAT